MGNKFAQGNWVPIHRRILHTWIYRDGECFKAYFDLKCRAAYSDQEYLHRGRVLLLAPGQVACTVLELAAKWGWARKTVDRFLTHLEQSKELEIQSLTWNFLSECWEPKKGNNGILVLTLISQQLVTSADVKVPTEGQRMSQRNGLNVPTEGQRMSHVPRRVGERDSEKGASGAPQAPPSPPQTVPAGDCPEGISFLKKLRLWTGHMKKGKV